MQEKNIDMIPTEKRGWRTTPAQYQENKPEEE